jgi:hypothetical protein
MKCSKGTEGNLKVKEQEPHELKILQISILGEIIPKGFFGLRMQVFLSEPNVL